MTRNLYKQAIADAKKLREIAEQNAKNAIIESITPKIRELIESQILEESDDLDSNSDLVEEAMLELSPDTPSEDEEFDLTPEAAQELREMLNVEQESVEEEISEESKILTTADQVKECNEYMDSLNEMLENVRGISPEALEEADLKKYITVVAIADKAAEKLDEKIVNTDGAGIFESVIKNSQDQIQEFKKEIKEMKRSLRDLLSEEVITIELDLGDAEAPEDVEVRLADEEEAEPADEEVGEEEDFEVAEEDEEEGEEEVEEVDEGMGHDDDMMELDDLMMELEEDMEEGDMHNEEEDADEGMMHYEEEDADEGMHMMESLDDDTVLEIDENMLREELAKLMQESEDSAEEVIEEASEEEEVLEETAEPVATEQNDELQAEIESYQSAVTDLQSQLAEMSLFNAKLLYTNKLLMNSDLSQTQRAQAIETLDDAASLREVKLLFKTLTESFSKRAEGKTSSRNIGGASRPTSSASMNLNESRESTEANRWALLAGIK